MSKPVDDLTSPFKIAVWGPDGMGKDLFLRNLWKSLGSVQHPVLQVRLCLCEARPENETPPGGSETHLWQIIRSLKDLGITRRKSQMIRAINHQSHILSIDNACYPQAFDLERAIVPSILNANLLVIILDASCCERPMAVKPVSKRAADPIPHPPEGGGMIDLSKFVRQSVYFKERALVNEPGFPLPIKSSISISKYSRQVEQLLDLPRNQEQWICSLLVDPGQTRNHQDPDYAETLITETFGKDMWRILSKRRKARVRLFYDEDFDQLAPSHSQLKKNRKFWIPTTFTELVLGLLENRERQRIAQSGGSLSCLLRSENLALYVPYVWEAHHPKKGFYNKQVG